MPRPFKFKLEKILDYRGQVEDQARMAVAKAQQQYQEHVRHMDRLRAALTEHENSLNHMKNPKEGDLWLWRNYRDRMLEDIWKAEDVLKYYAKVLALARERLVAAAKDKKIMVKLKERQSAIYFEEEAKKEQGEFDEMATIRYKPKDL